MFCWASFSPFSSKEALDQALELLGDSFLGLSAQLSFSSPCLPCLSLKRQSERFSPWRFDVEDL
jgi:hypothetical protein